MWYYQGKKASAYIIDTHIRLWNRDLGCNINGAIFSDFASYQMDSGVSERNFCITQFVKGQELTIYAMEVQKKESVTRSSTHMAEA